MDLLHIADKYINHLNSLERMLDYNDIIKGQYFEERKSDEFSIPDVMNLVIEVKTSEFNNDLSSEEYKQNQKTLKKLMEKRDLDFVYNNIEIEKEDNDEPIIKISSGMLNKFFMDQIKTHDNFHTDVAQLKNSIIISLVTSLELLISDLFKDFIINIDKSDFLKKRVITYNDLLKIGDIQEAKDFLLDQYIEDLLRSSYLNWIDEIEKKMKIKISRINVIKEQNALQYINETFQRRHLLIHNDGIVNDLYLTKTDPFIINSVKKGDRLETTTEYITESIKLFKKVGIILIFLYGKKRYKNSINQFSSDFNNTFLSLAIEGCHGVRCVYKEIFNDPDFNHESQLMSKVNYFLSYKLNDEFDKVKSEVEEFYVETLSAEYRMAKSILLDNIQDAIIEFKSYINSISDDEFFHVIDWPLIKLVRERKPFKDFIRDKLQEILNSEEEDEIEEATLI